MDLESEIKGYYIFTESCNSKYGIVISRGNPNSIIEYERTFHAKLVNSLPKSFWEQHKNYIENICKHLVILLASNPFNKLLYISSIIPLSEAAYQKTMFKGDILVACNGIVFVGSLCNCQLNTTCPHWNDLYNSIKPPKKYIFFRPICNGRDSLIIAPVRVNSKIEILFKESSAIYLQITKKRNKFRTTNI